MLGTLSLSKRQVLPPRPILFRQSVGSDVSQWYWEERSATLRAGSILCGRGGTSRRAGPRSHRAQAREGATPSARTTFIAAWLEQQTRRLKPRRALRVRAGATPAAATNYAAVRGIEDRAVSKTAAPHGAWACKSPRPHQFIDGWWNVYTRVSETRGRKPVQVRILSRRPFQRFVL